MANKAIKEAHRKMVFNSTFIEKERTKQGKWNKSQMELIENNYKMVDSILPYQGLH